MITHIARILLLIYLTGVLGYLLWLVRQPINIKVEEGVPVWVLHVSRVLGIFYTAVTWPVLLWEIIDNGVTTK